MSNSSATLLQYEGKIVPRSFAAGFVVLSYLVSFIGAWTTLELINKKTAGRGLYNWYLLIGSAISMGGIATFGMHFIGNRAIVLAGGLDVLQIAYSPGYTVLSFFVPIVVLLGAFMAVGSNDSVSLIRVSLGGTLTGLSFVGMHYLGQAGISNYTSVYKVANVVGSAVVAICASIAALAIFFLLRASWTNSWWKRVGTAVVLAGAVSGMHWLSSVGTQYRLKRVVPSTSQNLSNNWTVILVIVLSISACFILIAFSLLAQRRRSRSANRAQQVVLAAGIFDSEGRLMVTSNGEIPTRKITNEYIERSFDDIFGNSHPAFLWIFRTTRNWLSITGLIPAMRNHIRHTSVMEGSRPGTRGAELSLVNDAGEPIEDYSIIFRELFCIAASDLAAQIGEPLERSGVLFDEILSTGQMVKSQNIRMWKNKSPSSSVDIERSAANKQYFGKGQLLFLIRRVNRRESEQLSARGYRFANISNVVNILASSMQINNADLLPRLEAMRDYSVGNPILEPGVHMACFSIRASVNGGFDVLVRKDASNQLPTMQLPLDKLEIWHLEFLSHFDNMSVSQCLRIFKAKATSPDLPQRDQVFAAQLHDTLEALIDEISDPFFNEAILVAKPVNAPCRGMAEDSAPSQATLIAFRIIVPIHLRALGHKLDFSPLSFFKLQQHVYDNSPDHAVFARTIHREFGPILNKAAVTAPGDSKNGSNTTFSRLPGGNDGSLDVPTNTEKRNLWTGVKFWGRKSAAHGDIVELSEQKRTSDTSSEKHLVETQSFGGIMVSQEVSINIHNVEDEEKPSNMNIASDNEGRKRGETNERLRIGTTGVALREVEDSNTYVDELFTACVQAR